MDHLKHSPPNCLHPVSYAVEVIPRSLHAAGNPVSFGPFVALLTFSVKVMRCSLIRFASSIHLFPSTVDPVRPYACLPTLLLDEIPPLSAGQDHSLSSFMGLRTPHFHESSLRSRFFPLTPSIFDLTIHVSKSHSGASCHSDKRFQFIHSSEQMNIPPHDRHSIHCDYPWIPETPLVLIRSRYTAFFFDGYTTNFLPSSVLEAGTILHPSK